jgi:hypothetical protein
MIEEKLEKSGQKAQLEEFLRQKLIECGWKDQLKQHCLGKKIRPLFYHFLSFCRADQTEGS